MTKPTVAFTGKIAGIILCRCGAEMKQRDGVYRCSNPVCEHSHGKYTAVIQGVVFFYAVEEGR